jgi:hypothetical protein
VTPLDEATFLARVDFLPTSDQPHEDAPLRHALSEVHEVLGLGTTVTTAVMLSCNLLGVERALRLVEYQDVFRRDQARVCLE